MTWVWVMWLGGFAIVALMVAWGRGTFRRQERWMRDVRLSRRLHLTVPRLFWVVLVVPFSCFMAMLCASLVVLGPLGADTNLILEYTIRALLVGASIAWLFPDACVYAAARLGGPRVAKVAMWTTMPPGSFDGWMSVSGDTSLYRLRREVTLTLGVLHRKPWNIARFKESLEHVLERATESHPSTQVAKAMCHALDGEDDRARSIATGLAAIRFRFLGNHPRLLAEVWLLADALSTGCWQVLHRCDTTLIGFVVRRWALRHAAKDPGMSQVVERARERFEDPKLEAQTVRRALALGVPDAEQARAEVLDGILDEILEAGERWGRTWKPARSGPFAERLRLRAWLRVQRRMDERIDDLSRTRGGSSWTFEDAWAALGRFIAETDTALHWADDATAVALTRELIHTANNHAVTWDRIPGGWIYAGEVYRYLLREHGACAPADLVALLENNVDATRPEVRSRPG